MRGLIILCVAMFLLATAPMALASDYTSKTLEFTVYSDGVTEVKYGVELNSVLVQIEVFLPGSPYDSLMVLNEEGFPLEASVNPTGVTIDSIGSTHANIFYYSLTLTSKKGPVWTFNVSSPITTRIILPLNSAIISLSELPIEFGVDQGRPNVVMPPGQISVSYLTGALDAMAKARDALDEAKDYLELIENDGVILTEARALLDEAYDLFEDADYPNVIIKAGLAIDQADTTKREASNASTLIDLAGSAVSRALSEGRIDGIEDAVTYLNQATTAFEGGYYSSAIESATLSSTLADRASKPVDIGLLALGVTVVVLLVSGVYMIRRRVAAKAQPLREQFEVDLDVVFREHPELRYEDREALKFIAEAGGEVFANEIRERLGLARTSAWRMIRRLVGLEILEERKVGGQSLVSINRRYRR